MMRARETAQGDGIYYTTRRTRVVWIYSTTEFGSTAPL